MFVVYGEFPENRLGFIWITGDVFVISNPPKSKPTVSNIIHKYSSFQFQRFNTSLRFYFLSRMFHSEVIPAHSSQLNEDVLRAGDCF